MRVFVTGATGFIGSHLVPELVSAGHRVAGLTRSEEGAHALTGIGADALRGDVNDLPRLREAVSRADAVIHLAFSHDFADLQRHSEEDRRVITALGEALADTDRPLLVTSGTGLARRDGERLAVETDPTLTAAEFPRGGTEEAADAVKEQGGRVVVVRLPQVHDRHRQGRLAEHIRLAHERGYVAYVGEGDVRLAAAHVSDVVRLYRLVLERGEAGRRCHAVAEEGVPMRVIAEALEARLGLPVRAIKPNETPGYFGRLASVAQADLAASSAWTRRALGWEPAGPSLLSDLRAAEADGA